MAVAKGELHNCYHDAVLICMVMLYYLIHRVHSQTLTWSFRLSPGQLSASSDVLAGDA